mgnify:CR=1 FL=1
MTSTTPAASGRHLAPVVNSSCRFNLKPSRMMPKRRNLLAIRPAGLNNERLAAQQGVVDAATMANIMKLSRVLMLVFVAIIVAIWWDKKHAEVPADGGKRKVAFPWFMLGFIATAAIGTLMLKASAGNRSTATQSTHFAGKNTSARPMHSATRMTEAMSDAPKGLTPFFSALKLTLMPSAAMAMPRKTIAGFVTTLLPGS